MLVEHSFVTTLPKDEAFEYADMYLSQLGYHKAYADDIGMQWRKGRDKPGVKLSFDQLPQSVKIEFDRGRVVIAASIHEARKVHVLHRSMMIETVEGLEKVLVRFEDIESATRSFYAVLGAVHGEFASRRTQQRVVFGCVIAIPILLIVFLVIGIIISAL